MRFATPAHVRLAGLLLAAPLAAAAQTWSAALPATAVRLEDFGAGESRALASHSADGRWWLFVSRAPNVAAGVVDRNGLEDVFLYDRDTASATLVSHAAVNPLRAAHGSATAAVISADGRWVFWEGNADNVDASIVDSNRLADVFVYDRTTGANVLVSRGAGANVAANQASEVAAISADGGALAFNSYATDLVAGQVEGNDLQDAFVQFRATATTRLVSRVAGTTATTGSSYSLVNAMDAAGAVIVIDSGATNLVAGQADTGEFDSDLFAYAASTNQLTLVSHAAGLPLQTADGYSTRASMDGSGRWIAFESRATNLAGTSDVNGGSDVFLHDRSTGQNVLVSHVAGAAGTSGNFPAINALVSGNGAFVVFQSFASNLVTGVTDAGGQDVFRYDRAAGTNALLSGADGSATVAAGGASTSMAVSFDGQCVLVGSLARLAPGISDGSGTFDAFVRGPTGTTLVSRSVSDSTRTLDQPSHPAALANACDFVALDTTASDASNLPDTLGYRDAFIAPVAAGPMAPASLRRSAQPVAGRAGSGGVLAIDAVATPGLRRVLFGSSSPDLVPLPGTFYGQQYLGDRSAADVLLLSHMYFDLGVPSQGVETASDAPLDGHATTALFTSTSAVLVAPGIDVNTASDLFAATVDGGITAASHTDAATPRTGNRATWSGRISRDGQWILMRSQATDIVTGYSGPADAYNLYFVAAQGTTVKLASHAFDSPLRGVQDADDVDLSYDGRFALIASNAPDLVAGFVDGNGSASDLYIVDRETGGTVLVSHALGQPQRGGNSVPAASSARLSANGDWVAFASYATDMVNATDANNARDVFLFERATGTITLVSHAAGDVTSSGNGESAGPSISDAGACVAFTSSATNLDATVADSNAQNDVFLHQRGYVATTLLSLAHDAAASANGSSIDALVNARCGTVAFASYATNLVAGVRDDNGDLDVFAWDRAPTAMSIVSVSGDYPGWTAAGGSRPTAINANGSSILVASDAGDLSADVGDGNNASDAYLFDRPAPLFADGFE